MKKAIPDIEFNDAQVDWVSSLLQGHMARHGIESMTPDECAQLLHQSGLFTIGRGLLKPGFRFRQMLPDGRDGKIALVQGAEQAANRRWTIRREIRSDKREPAMAGA